MTLIEKTNFITLEKNIKFKNSASNYLIYILNKNDDSKNDIESITKNDRPISSKLFNKIMKIAQLPYEMTGRGSFIIDKIN